MACHIWHEKGMVPAQRFLVFVLLYRCMDSVLTLVPVPQDHPVNDTVEVGIYRTQECPDGYYRVKRNDESSGNTLNKGTNTSLDICKLCSACRKGERELETCTPTRNRRCGCLDGREYYIELNKCIPKIGVKQNWTLQDYNSWIASISPAPTSQFQSLNVTMKVSQDIPMVNSNGGEMKSQAEHAVKPDWTDFYILTVSSTAVLFFTLSLVLLFLMAVMKARSWYLYRRLPGSGITLCFRGWLSRLLLRQRDRSTDPIQEISMTGRVVQLNDQGTTARETEDKHEEDDEICREEPVLVSSSPSEDQPHKDDHLIDNSEVVDYLRKINAVVCCADLKLTFPEKTTYVSSCITSEADVKETRSQGNPNFILQACRDTVNVVLGHKSHKCCRNRNMLTLTSSDECELGHYEAATLEVQDWSDSQLKETPATSLSADTAETSFLIQASAKLCRHQEDVCIHPDDILNLYTEIATPFKESRDLKFNGCLQLYLKKDSSSFPPAPEKVKLRYKRRQKTERCSDAEETEALLQQGEEEVDCREAQTKILKERPHSKESEESYAVSCPSLEDTVEKTLPPTSQGCLQYSPSSRKASSPPCDSYEEGEGRGDGGPTTLYGNIESCIPLMQTDIESCRVWSDDCIHDEAVDEGAVEVVVDVHNDLYYPGGEQESKAIPQEGEGDVKEESQGVRMKRDCRDMKKLLVVTSV